MSLKEREGAAREIPLAAPTLGVPVERLLSQQEVLRQVIEEISSELELRPLLTRIVRLACELLGAGDGSIGLYDEDRNVIRIEAIYRMPESEMGAEMAPGVGLAGQVLLRREPVVLDRYGEVPDPTLPELAENAVLGVPILWRERLVGFFGIGAKPPRRFDAQDVEILSLFGRHVAIAIDNARRYRREQQRAEQLGLLARVVRVISSSLQLDGLLQDAADAVHEILGYQNVAIPILDPEEPTVLVLKAAGGSYRDLLRGEFRQTIWKGLMGAAVQQRSTILVNDVAEDPRFVPTPGSSGIRAELAVPILLGDQILGVLNVESAHPFSAGDAARLEITADHLAVAIRNASLFEQAQRAAVLEERQRLARELHDSVTQMLFSATLIAQAVPSAYRRDPEEGERRLTRLLELNRSALGEMRALLRELRPEEERITAASTGEFPIPTVFRVRRDGLIEVLDGVLRDAERDGLEVVRSWQGYRRQTPDREEALFRVAQEALNNVTKHARARQVEVRLDAGPETVCLSVIDDGAGFDVGQALARTESDGGIGLRSMRERTRALGGRFELTSRLGEGTRLEVLLPPTDLRPEKGRLA